MTRYCIADDVAWVSRDELDAHDLPTAFLARVPRGFPIVLEGSGCMVWLALADGGTLDEITVAAAEMTDVGPDDIRSDVAELVDQLLVIGVVVEEG